jgi:hypothetical protein
MCSFRVRTIVVDYNLFMLKNLPSDLQKGISQDVLRSYLFSESPPVVSGLSTASGFPARGVSTGRSGFLGFNDAATGRAIATKHGINHRRGAAHAGLDVDRADRTIPGTRAAFHARVAIIDPHPPIVSSQDRMRAHFQARSATGAFFIFKGQGHHVFQVQKSGHDRISSSHK